MMTTWFITGCSTGLGRALATQVLEAGHRAVITARDVTSLDTLVEAYPDTALGLPLDVCNAGQIAAAVEQAMQRFGGVDVLVNNAGYGYRAAVEEGEAEAIEQLFATNFLGAVNVMNAVLPNMRERRNGMVINISSIAGQRTIPGSGYYAASKAALESVTEALQQEAGPLGIRTAIVQPGPFRTDFAGRSLHQSKTPIDAYADTVGTRRKEHDTMDGNQAGDPVEAAKAIMVLAEHKDPPLRLVLGRQAIELAKTDLQQQLDDLTAWEAVGLQTDFP